MYTKEDNPRLQSILDRAIGLYTLLGRYTPIEYNNMRRSRDNVGIIVIRLGLALGYKVKKVKEILDSPTLHFKEYMKYTSD